MSKEKTIIRQEKKKGLTDKELIEKYESGVQPISEMISELLAKTALNAPIKLKKR